jgi:site-specific recombinase XerD
MEKVITVIEAIDLMIVALKAEGAKLETVKWYLHRLARFKNEYGNINVKEITLDDIRSYIVKIRELDISPYSLFSLVRVVRHLFKWLYDERKIDDSFYKRIKAPKLPQSMPKAIDLKDARALIENCPNTPIGKRDKAIIYFLLDTGCRVGGLCGLKVNDIDQKNGNAQVFEKGEKVRSVFFGDVTSKAIKEWINVRPFRNSEYLFTSIKEDRKMTGFTVIQLLRRLARRSGVKGRVNPHSFRHAFAREFILNGGDIGTVSQILGHTQIHVTNQFYSDFNSGVLKLQHDKFSPLVKGANLGVGKMVR